MGKAYRAPMDTYVPRMAISEHAIQRFRERARSFLEQGGHLSDEAVGFQVDDAVWDAMHSDDRTFEIVDSNQPSRLVHIESEAWGSLWALVRENKNPRYPQKWVVITLLTDWQMTQNALDGRYTGNVPRMPQFARHFEEADAKARARDDAPKPAVVIARPAAPPVRSPRLPLLATIEAQAAGAGAGDAPAPDGVGAGDGQVQEGEAAAKVAAQVAPPAEAPAEELRLLSYLGPAGTRQFEEVPRDQVPLRVESLREAGVLLKTIRIWRPARLRVEVE